MIDDSSRKFGNFSKFLCALAELNLKEYKWNLDRFLVQTELHLSCSEHSTPKFQNIETASCYCFLLFISFCPYIIRKADGHVLDNFYIIKSAGTESLTLIIILTQSITLTLTLIVTLQLTITLIQTLSSTNDPNHILSVGSNSVRLGFSSLPLKLKIT